MPSHPHLPLRAGIALTAAGGALGAVARYGLQLAFPSHGVAFPWTTFAINVVGSGLLALIGATPAVRRRPSLPVFLGTGVLGGFTTMSTASVDTFRLLDGGAAVTGLAYALGTLVAALALAGAVSRLDPLGEQEFEAEEGDR
ncbi:MAG: CrcB family protein [Marmoricola sp.]|nr:CrcB family protein [Marmoricola sp.]